MKVESPRFNRTLKVFMQKCFYVSMAFIQIPRQSLPCLLSLSSPVADGVFLAFTEGQSSVMPSFSTYELL